MANVSDDPLDTPSLTCSRLRPLAEALARLPSAVSSLNHPTRRQVRARTDAYVDQVFERLATEAPVTFGDSGDIEFRERDGSPRGQARRATLNGQWRPFALLMVPYSGHSELWLLDDPP